jgi:hypothetical protein
VTPVQSLEAAVKDWGVANAIKIGTHARPVAGIKEWKTQELKSYLQSETEQPKNACFLLFGTGFGMTTEFMQGLDGVLESIKGAPPNDYRHLSVRSAVSIYLDRVVGPC